jgi:hypothetical protein
MSIELRTERVSGSGFGWDYTYDMSRDTEIDEGAEEALREKIRRRVAEIDAKAVSMVSWAETRSRPMATLHDER